MDKNALMEKIESLDVKESWKEKFRLFAEAGLKSGGFFPKFENKDVLKGKYRAEFNTSPFLLAIISGGLFTIFYYIYLGLYKKSGLLFILLIIITVVAEAVTQDTKSYLLAMLLLAGYSANFVNYDFYRKKVLGEDFWW